MATATTIAYNFDPSIDNNNLLKVMVFTYCGY